MMRADAPCVLEMDRAICGTCGAHHALLTPARDGRRRVWCWRCGRFGPYAPNAWRALIGWVAEMIEERKQRALDRANRERRER